MAGGLEVVIKYKDAKYQQVASPTLSHNAEIAILKKDLAHLRVHSPSQKNVRRVDGSFVMHWPSAGTSLKVDEASVPDTLYTRWIKLCTNDPESLKLREFLSIESITLTQECVDLSLSLSAFVDIECILSSGAVIATTSKLEEAHEDVPETSLAARLGDPLREVPEPFVAVSVVPSSPPTKPSSSLQKPPPTAPRLERERLSRPQYPKRPLGSSRESSPSPVRRKMDSVALQNLDKSIVALRSLSTTLQDNTCPAPSRDDQQWESLGSWNSSSPSPLIGDTGTLAASDTTQRPLPSLEEPRYLDVRLSVPETPKSPLPLPSKSFSRPEASSHRGSSASADNGNYSQQSSRVSHLTRELWDTRRQLMAMQAREKVILEDLNKLGARPQIPASEDISKLKAELRQERIHRIRAERALHDVERECREPFVVPALFQAFMNISELSS
ncbi:hypothetical protein BDN67DRAFT_1013282 [Paxillus ammoniavirescens]|nr:hypothetical protein BDN67DRAFT_1013282 [Paxillus ammoniavirescens]